MPDLMNCCSTMNHTEGSTQITSEYYVHKEKFLDKNKEKIL